MPDVDIDFANRDHALKLFKHVPASIIKDEEIERLRKIAEETGDYSGLWFTGGFVAGIALAIGIFWVSVQIVDGGTN